MDLSEIKSGRERGAYVYALMGEARRHRRRFLLGIAEQGREAFDGGHGDVAPVVSCQERLALEVEEEYRRCHCGDLCLGADGKMQACRMPDGRTGRDPYCLQARSGPSVLSGQSEPRTERGMRSLGAASAGRATMKRGLLSIAVACVVDVVQHQARYRLRPRKASSCPAQQPCQPRPADVQLVDLKHASRDKYILVYM